MSVLTRQSIAEKQDLKNEIVNVPEWGGDVCLRMMSGAERESWELDMYNRSNGGKKSEALKGLKVSLLSLCITDEGGNKIFDDDEGRRILGSKSASAIDKLFNHAQKLNGLTANDVEELEKN